MKRVRVRVRVIKSVHQLDEEFEDTKRGIIIISISKKNRQHNGQKIPKRKSESVYRRRTNNTLSHWEGLSCLLIYLIVVYD
jgi:hypothetical protein